MVIVVLIPLLEKAAVRHMHLSSTTVLFIMLQTLETLPAIRDVGHNITPHNAQKAQFRWNSPKLTFVHIV